MWKRDFWLAVAERAIKTAAQTAVALIGVEMVSIVDLDAAQIAGVSATAALLSVLTSIGSSRIGVSSGPSLGPEALASEE